jgi:Na+/H+-dicarboxylate symporter
MDSSQSLHLAHTSVDAAWCLSDRIRTAINVLGDAYAACTVSHYLEQRIKPRLEGPLLEEIAFSG